MIVVNGSNLQDTMTWNITVPASLPLPIGSFPVLHLLANVLFLLHPSLTVEHWPPVPHAGSRVGLGLHHTLEGTQSYLKEKSTHTNIITHLSSPSPYRNGNYLQPGLFNSLLDQCLTKSILSHAYEQSYFILCLLGPLGSNMDDACPSCEVGLFVCLFPLRKHFLETPLLPACPTPRPCFEYALNSTDGQDLGKPRMNFL